MNPGGIVETGELERLINGENPVDNLEIGEYLGLFIKNQFYFNTIKCAFHNSLYYKFKYKFTTPQPPSTSSKKNIIVK